MGCSCHVFELNRSFNFKWAIFWVVPLLYSVSDINRTQKPGSMRIPMAVAIPPPKKQQQPVKQGNINVLIHL
jgi:hypothetical protein